jgi:hypothetical protein
MATRCSPAPGYSRSCAAWGRPSLHALQMRAMDRVQSAAARPRSTARSSNRSLHDRSGVAGAALGSTSATQVEKDEASNSWRQSNTGTSRSPRRRWPFVTPSWRTTSAKRNPDAARGMPTIRARRIEAIRPDDLAVGVGVQWDRRPTAREVRWAVPIRHTQSSALPRRTRNVPPAKSGRGDTEVPPTALIVGIELGCALVALQRASSHRNTSRAAQAAWTSPPASNGELAV